MYEFERIPIVGNTMTVTIKIDPASINSGLRNGGRKLSKVDIYPMHNLFPIHMMEVT